MKVRCYLRIGKKQKGKGYSVAASSRPCLVPLEVSNYSKQPVPTVLLALDLDIPDHEFDAARILLEAKIKDTIPAVSIKQVELD